MRGLVRRPGPFADLQFIRLNGAVVGSVVGMLLTLVKLALG